MRDTLIALPVSGDAFLWRSDRTILVDSGGSGKRLAALLAVHASDLTKIDIAVCTHADSDHAGGFVSLLDHWRPTRPTDEAPIGEFWLPGAWADSVPDLLTNAKLLADKLVEELMHIAKTHPQLNQADSGLEQIDAQLADRGRSADDDRRRAIADQIGDREHTREEPPWMRELRSRAEEIVRHSPQAARVLQQASQRVRYRRRKRIVGAALATYWLSLIETAERIRSIAVSAIKHNVPIRWFDYRLFENTGRASGGDPGLLIPINAVEQWPVPKVTAYFAMLRLSVANEQCLSFMTADGGPWPFYKSSVLFCGDSPMGNGPGYKTPFPLPLDPRYGHLFATAPHHGAESNAIAYQHLSAAVGADRIFWIRSGGTRKHPEATFRKVPHDQRICTHCPHAKKPKLPVVLSSTFTGWPVASFRGHLCSC